MVMRQIAITVLLACMVSSVSAESNVDHSKVYKACYDGLTHAYFSPKYSEPTVMYTKSKLQIESIKVFGKWVMASLFIEDRDPGVAILHINKDGNYIFVLNGTAFPDIDENQKYYICNGWHIPTKIFLKK